MDKNKNKNKKYVISLLILLFLILEMSFWIILYFLLFRSMLFTFFIDLLFHILLIRYVSLQLIFIGGFSLFQKYVLFSFNKGFSIGYLEYINKVKPYLLSLLSSSDLTFSHLNVQSQLNSFTNQLKSDKNIFDHMNNPRNQSCSLLKTKEIQLEFINLISNLIKLVVDSRLLEDLLYDDSFVRDDKTDRYVNKILLDLESLEILLKEKGNPNGIHETFLNFIDFNRQIASFNYIRSEMLVKYNTKEGFLKGSNKKMISYLIINSKKDDLNNSNSNSNKTDDIIRNNEDYSLSYINTVNETMIDTIISNNKDELHSQSEDSTVIPTVINKNIDNILFENIKIPFYKSNNKKPIMIICCGNGGCFELFHRNDYWIRFYLSKGYDICLWNYRGYGLSTGQATFSNIKQDIELVYEYLTGTLRYKNVSCHGISIGGVPSCHLGSRFKLTNLISDRNFNRIDQVIRELNENYGKYLFYLYKFMFCNENQSNNLENYVKSVRNSRKTILLSDRNDSIIKEKCSLALSFTKKLSEVQLGGRSNLIFDVLGGDKDKYNDFKDVFIYLNSLFTDSINDDINDIKGSKANKGKKLSNTYLNLNESILTDTTSIEGSINNSEESSDLVLENIKDILTSSIYDIYSILSERNYVINKLDRLLRMIFIWGITDEGLDPHPIILGAIRLYSLSLSFKKFSKKIDNENGLKVLVEKLSIFFHYLKCAYYEMNIRKDSHVQENDFQNLEIKREVSSQGFYIKLSCGHNGVLYSKESRILSRILEI